MDRVYELMFVIRAYLPDNVRNEVYDFINGKIAEAKGEIILKDVWGKRYMAYKINGQKEGYYVVYQLKMKPSGMTKLKKELGSRSEIIRYIVSLVKEDSELGVAYGKKSIEEIDTAKPKNKK
ncbi:30S ribosomal protein S6 [Candidatus Dojkabacteria bacterium]|nr:30S ribosomal protein S6 [Candidatus Dojkabacteria bacterium]